MGDISQSQLLMKLIHSNLTTKGHSLSFCWFPQQDEGLRVWNKGGMRNKPKKHELCLPELRPLPFEQAKYHLFLLGLTHLHWKHT